MPSKPITHSRWLKGLQAAFDRMAQPKGSVSRISNLVYTRRGGLKTCDGSSVFSAWGGVQPLVWNPLTAKMWREMIYYAPASGLRTGYYGLYSDPTAHLATSAGTATLTTAPPGGNGLTGTYYVRVAAVDGIGGEMAAGPEAFITLSNQALNVAWTPVVNAYGYNVYIGTGAGGEVLWLPAGSSPTAAGVSAPGGATSSVIVDSTWIQNGGQLPSAQDTTGSTMFTLIPPGGYSAANVITGFPPASSTFSIGQATTLASTSTSTPPGTTQVAIRPTTSAQGGPVSSPTQFPNPFINPAQAYDGDPATFASAQTQIGVSGSNGLSGGASQTWSGWPAAPSGVSALTINVTAAMTLTGGPTTAACRITIAYSQDGGSTYNAMQAVNQGFAQQTFSASLRTNLDLSQLRLNVTVEAPVDKAVLATSQVFEIWVEATTPSSGSTGSVASGSISPHSATPNGGIQGICGPLPQIVALRGKMILALGNGYPPYESDGSTAGTAAITNTFTAVYPTWVISTNYNQGDQIEAVVSGVAYVFTCTQGGTSAASGTPAFSATLGQTTTDHNIIWKNSGQVSNSPAPRGAAHAEVYAGSVWLAGTSPGITDDQLDGPSALRMSTLNNPDSWNPLNAAQISPDDSDECNGIKAFTVAEAGIAPQNFLMYFKFFSTYMIQGVFGASNFAITRLQTDLGCTASRTIQFVPGYGIMRLSHLGFAVTDGISDKLQDPEAIRPYLFAESTEGDITPLDWGQVWFSKSAQTVDPPMYVAAFPLVGANRQLIRPLTGTTVTPGSQGVPGLTAGSYYVQVGLRGPNGVTSLSAVMGPFTVSGGGGGGGGGQPPPTGVFSILPTSLAFGSVPANTLTQLVQNLSYSGTLAGQTLNSVTLSSPQFTLASMPPLPQTFGNNMESGWYVGINQPPGTYSATMTIATSLEVFSVPITAVAVAGNLSVSPAQLNFSNTAVGATSPPLTLTITNNETVPVQLGGYAFVSAANAPSTDFAFVVAPTIPTNIGAGQSVSYQVVATPHSGVGTLTGALDLYKTVGSSNVLFAQVPLQVFVPSPPATQSFVEKLGHWLQEHLHLGQPPQAIQELPAPRATTTNSLVVSNPAVPPGYFGYRVWFGTDPANLNQFVDGNAQSITIQGPGTGGSPPTGIAGSLTRLFCYDLVLKIWTVVDLPFSISAMKQFRVVGSVPMTALGGSYDTAIRRWQQGDTDWDTGALATQTRTRVIWAFLDAEVHNESATQRIFHNQVIIRGDGGPPSISVGPQVNGYVLATIRAAMIALGDGQFEARARIMQTIENMALGVSGEGPAVIESISYTVQPKPVGGPLVIS